MPNATALIRTPRGPKSWAAARTKPREGRLARGEVRSRGGRKERVGAGAQHDVAAGIHGREELAAGHERRADVHVHDVLPELVVDPVNPARVGERRAMHEDIRPDGLYCRSESFGVAQIEAMGVRFWPTLAESSCAFCSERR
jgi:hypothetical protein